MSECVLALSELSGEVLPVSVMAGEELILQPVKPIIPMEANNINDITINNDEYFLYDVIIINPPIIIYHIIKYLKMSIDVNTDGTAGIQSLS